jgi:hypothetical protein
VVDLKQVVYIIILVRNFTTVHRIFHYHLDLLRVEIYIPDLKYSYLVDWKLNTFDRPKIAVGIKNPYF